MRKFKIGTYSWDRHNNPKKVGKISKFVVTDALTDEEIGPRDIAVFPVTDVYPEDHQREMATILMNFLNGRLEAIEKTFEGDALLQRIIL